MDLEVTSGKAKVGGQGPKKLGVKESPSPPFPREGSNLWWSTAWLSAPEREEGFQ